MRIHYKITFVFGLITALILSGIYLYLNSTLKTYTYQRIRDTLTRESAMARSFLENICTEGSGPQELDLVADEIGEKLALRVTIIGRDGVVLGDSELDGRELREVENHLYRPEVQKALDSGTGESRRFSTTVKADMLYLAKAFGDHEEFGVIRLSIPLSEIEMISERLKNLLVVSILIAFALSLLISFAASILISKPVQEVSATAKRIASGDFSQRLLFHSNDEIGDLSRAIHFMSEQIRLRIEQVESNTSRLEAILLSMFEGVMAVNEKGTILLMNHALEELFHAPKEVVGKKPLEVVRSIEVQDLTERALEMDSGVETREISVFMETEKVLLVHATPIIREGVRDGAVLLFHDITELKRLEQVRRDFVANVSHELRTPVSSIQGFAETLLDGAIKDGENAQDFLKIIHADAERLARLITDLLDLSRIESGKLSLRIEPCPVGPVIERVVKELKARAETKSIVIVIDLPAGLPDLRADETYLAQALLNLLDNAIMYTPKEGRITMSAKAVNDSIQIDVSDTGIGIPEEDIPRIFERFYRVDKARSRDLGGTGLGLSIVKNIVQAHGGKVYCTSALGRGSTFSLTIPSV